jgi:branched-chain amino acid transport system substrate-binding protein
MPPVTELAPEHRALAYMSLFPLAQDEKWNAETLNLARQMAEYIKETSPEGYRAQTGRAIAPKKRSSVPVNVLIVLVALIFGVAVVAIPRSRGVNNNATLTLTPRFNETASARLTGRDFQLGVAAGLTGINDQRGQELLNGVELALLDRPSLLVGDKVHPIDLITQDTTCTASGGITVANTFIASPDLVAVIGADCEESCKAGADLYDRAGITTISPACTSPILTQADNPSFYRTIPSHAYTAIASAQFALANGWNTAVIIHDEQLIGGQLASAFRDEYESAGGTITFITIETTTFSMTNLVAQITEANPQAVYFAGRDATLVELRAMLPAELPLIGGLIISEAQFLADVGISADNIILAVLNAPNNPRLDALRQKYIAQFGTEPSSLVFAYAYDATIMLLDTAEAVATDENGLLFVDRYALRQALLDYAGAGVTGQLACAGDGDCAELGYTVYTIQNGELVIFGGE